MVPPTAYLSNFIFFFSLETLISEDHLDHKTIKIRLPRTPQYIILSLFLNWELSIIIL